MDKLAFIVPTGVGASLGGYAGDAGAVARRLSEKYTLIVNPNVVNAAVFSAINDNMLYTEGYAIDLFFKEEIALRISQRNKIGVIFDKAISEGVLNIHINTLNAMKVVYGIDTEYTVTDEAVGIIFEESSSGISTGNIVNPGTLLDAAKKLINKGCNALAPVCLFDESDDENYSSAAGIDIVGGVEAVISHLLTREFMLPTAHAPAFENTDITKKIVSPKAAAEYITPTFLPCIILGLYNAPQLIPIMGKTEADIAVKDLKGVLMPYNALGSTPIFKSNELSIPIYAIKENKSILNVTANNLGINDIIEVKTYEEFLKQY